MWVIKIEKSTLKFATGKVIWLPIIYDSAGQLASTSVSMCDADVRLSLYGSVVFTGGNTLLQGFRERLNRDLQLRAPSNTRLKMISANGGRFGAWGMRLNIG
uniref:Uncharacterized protein n=1 Tax=Glossina brevipalpis TaxID=37001 RepID=A0A1A9W3K5_9MUSC